MTVDEQLANRTAHARAAGTHAPPHRPIRARRSAPLLEGVEGEDAVSQRDLSERHSRGGPANDPSGAARIDDASRVCRTEVADDPPTRLDRDGRMPAADLRVVEADIGGTVASDDQDVAWADPHIGPRMTPIEHAEPTNAIHR